VLHLRTINQTTEPRIKQFNMAKSKLRQLVRFPWAADGCPWVGKLRTVLPLTVGLRDGAVRERARRRERETAGWVLLG
jgi:hypothetical protein